MRTSPRETGSKVQGTEKEDESSRMGDRQLDWGKREPCLETAESLEFEKKETMTK